MALAGGCLCGAIRYEIDTELDPELTSYCYCSLCRKAHAAACAAFSWVAADRFRWSQGKDLLSRYESVPGSVRCFCSRCGTQLAGEVESIPEWMGITLGSVDDADTIRPTAHVFVASGAPWHEISDEIPQHADWRPSLEKLFERLITSQSE